ncbi:pesticin C-terminus-like muramidase [Stieleria sp. TO1_6]|uniref:pesticin C-terminus-like muramidase n=1 Tax=Stieleria tagensis TaxID=2956795 RepID=UPI00209AD2AE|nr:pesticin C-terminus-like muramidase [Stieleria tagensis]MCO8123294.1 pesticin C-terminus-like muramidase [Stieleria tagensis]
MRFVHHFSVVVAFALVVASTCQANDAFKVERGQLTFDAEGQEGGPYHSRTPHVPSNSSGLTIGRGYDMKERSESGIKADLTAAGLAEANVNAYAKAAGLSGEKAKDFIKANKDDLVEITAEQQKSLFEITYKQIEKDVKRICSKADVVKAYGATDWAKLDSKIRDVLVDLRFRGDYTPKSRKLIQKPIAGNDLDAFKSALTNQANWPSVPEDRFNRRKLFLEKQE